MATWKITCSVCGETKTKHSGKKPRYCSHSCASIARAEGIGPSEVKRIGKKRGDSLTRGRARIDEMRELVAQGLSYRQIDIKFGLTINTTGVLMRADRPATRNKKQKMCTCCGKYPIPTEPVAGGVVLTRLCVRCWHAGIDSRDDGNRRGYAPDIHTTETHPSMGWIGI